MEAAETPSGQVLSTRGDEKNRDGEVVCRIGFEEYLSEWVKIATTRAGHLMGEESLDELIKHPERFAACYGVPGSETDELAETLHKTFKDVVYSSSPRHLKKRKSRQTRVEQMRRIYLLCKTPGANRYINHASFTGAKRYLGHTSFPELKDEDTAHPPVPALREPVHDAERRERWESEVDKLVAWTHSLSFEELDRP